MNKKLTGILAGATLCLLSAKAQFAFDQVQYFVGSGSDTALLVVDFRDGSSDSSYAWGYLFNGSKTGEDALRDVAADDRNFSVAIGSGFLNDVTYGRHAGIGGQPDFWSTWSGSDTASLTLNAGIGTPLKNGEWFALSYTDFAPARKPGLPIPAFDPQAFTASDVKTWVGSGPDSAVVIIDFSPATGGSSYAWGYLFTDSVTAAQMLTDLDAAESQLSVTASTFLNDIIYRTDSGIGGAPNFWGTWSGTNLGNWYLNAGIGSYLRQGDFFGMSYTDFAPALRPGTPQAVNNVNLAESPRYAYQIFPNPAATHLSVNGPNPPKVLRLLSSDGKLLRRWDNYQGEKISVKQVPAGTYLLEMDGEVQALMIQ